MVTMAPDARKRAASFTDDDVEIVVARPDVGPDAVSASATLLSDRERERARRFAFDLDRNRFIVARALLRQLLAARLGVRPGALEPGERALGFFQCWTRKEAFIKALGDGLFHPLDRFDVSLAPGEPAQILRVADVPGDRCPWRLEAFAPVPGFVAAAVVTERLIEDDR